MKRLRSQPPAAAPEGTQWFGGPVEWLSVSLSIQGDDVDSAHITAIFGAPPDHSQTKGAPLLRADGSVLRTPKSSRWSIGLNRKDTDEWDIEQACWVVLKRVPSDIEIWRSAAMKGAARLSIALSLESANQGTALEPELLKFIGDRDIGLDIHIYAPTKIESNTCLPDPS